jgi:outer membrane murein-binding lipoprotein Lpp
MIAATADSPHRASNQQSAMNPIQPSASDIRARVEELRNAVHQLRQDKQAEKAADLAKLAIRLEELLASRVSLIAK